MARRVENLRSMGAPTPGNTGCSAASVLALCNGHHTVPCGGRDQGIAQLPCLNQEGLTKLMHDTREPGQHGSRHVALSQAVARTSPSRSLKRCRSHLNRRERGLPRPIQSFFFFFLLGRRGLRPAQAFIDKPPDNIQTF